MTASSSDPWRTAAAGSAVVATAAFLVGAMAFGPGALAAQQPRTDFCTQTTEAALNACGHEARDDLAISIGICANESGEAARKACVAEALAAGQGDHALCRAQAEARAALCAALGEDPYDPPIKPANFVRRVTNPFMPWLPGSVWVYRGGDEKITVTVTDETKTVLGVKCTVVRDVVEEDGEPIEDTLDYYAQDRAGNVWYFGELSQSFENGELVSLEGSWLAGVDGAKPGIVMLANPKKGVVYRQEFALGDAEDAARVITTLGSAKVPAKTCKKSCVVTGDFTPVEPDVLEHKFYASGVGLVLELDPATGDRTELVKFKKP
ncbi:MAG: hypothetical protein WD673_11255 [Alphaproteobacteria bacterium]